MLLRNGILHAFLLVLCLHLLGALLEFGYKSQLLELLINHRVQLIQVQNEVHLQLVYVISVSDSLSFSLRKSNDSWWVEFMNWMSGR
jgi:hypothetical protein